MRAGDRGGRAAGKVVDQGRAVGGDGRRVEHDEVGRVALAHQAAVPQAEERRGLCRHHLHGLLERHQLAAAEHVAEERGGVVGAAHPVEVGTGVGAAEHRTGVGPDRGAHLPRLLVVVVGVGPQHGAQVVGEHDVEQGVEGSGAALGGDVGDGAECAARVGRRVGVADDVGAPREPAAGTRRPPAVVTLARSARTAGSAASPSARPRAGS